MRFVLSNWKMHTTVDEAVELARAIQAGLRARAEGGQALPTAIICPPAVSLVPVRSALDGPLLRLGAQNCHWEPEGPYTGEISATMLRGLVEYVMVGHSERRAAGETDEDVAKTVRAAADAGLVPILSVGADEQTRDAARQWEDQLRRGLAVGNVARTEVLVVYEPAGAVGAAEAADTDHVGAQVTRLKERLGQLGAIEPHVVYGGTVSEENLDRFAGLAVLDGVGATRAGLDPVTFLRMVDRVGQAAPVPPS